MPAPSQGARTVKNLTLVLEATVGGSYQAPAFMLSRRL